MNWLKLGNELLNVFRNASIATTIKLYLYFVYFKLYVTLSGAHKWIIYISNEPQYLKIEARYIEEL